MNKLDFPSEKFIEDYVVDSLRRERRCPISDQIVTGWAQQPTIHGYGVADIVKFSVTPKVINITVLELKNEPLKERHLSQLCRYMRGISLAAKRYSRFFPKGWSFEVCGELAGPLSPSMNDLIHLLPLLDKSVTVHDLSLTMDSGFECAEVPRYWHSNGQTPLAYRNFSRALFGFVRDLEVSLERQGVS